MKITFLQEAQKRLLSKHFSINSVTGELESGNYYQQYKKFNSIEVQCTTIEALHAELVEHASQGHAITKGNYQRPLNNESRAGLIDKTLPTQWLCLDFDGLKEVTDTSALLSPLGMHNVDHIVQYSASHGIKDGFRAHVFLMLSKPIMEPVLKQWFQWLNLTVPLLKENLTLTAPGTALRWPLDISLAEAHRLVYIAPPALDGVEDPFAAGGDCGHLERITLVKQQVAVYDISSALSRAQLNNVTQLKETAIGELRKRAGLRKKTERLKYDTKHEAYISSNPDQVTVTHKREERGFVYLDFAGGTGSMGYYHPENNFEIIHNFKGEPKYRTKDLAPDYYAECVSQRKEQSVRKTDLETGDKVKHFYFTEKQSGAYYKGTWYPETDTRVLDPARQRIQIDDFCMQNGMEPPAFIPIMETVFDPASPIFYDPDKGTINLYKPSKYKILADATKANKNIPSTIARLITHVVGDDGKAYNHFLNWLAFIWQTGKKPETAWVFHGTTGTGKGTLVEQVLSPLFGREQAMEITVQPLSENFNGYLLKTQILVIDEADTDGMANPKLVAAKLKNWITQPKVTIREMHKSPYAADSHTAFIITGNQTNLVLIDYNDRRYNVAPRQERKLLDVFELPDFNKLKKELPAFAHWLQAYQVDAFKVRQPLLNQARTDIQNVTSSSPVDIVRAIEQGDFRYFVDLLPSGIGEQNVSTAVQISSFNYLNVLKYIYAQLVSGQQSAVPLARDDVAAIFEYALDWRMRPTKFSKTVSKFGLKFSPLRIRGKSVRGIAVGWRASAEDMAVYNELVNEDAIGQNNITNIR